MAQGNRAWWNNRADIPHGSPPLLSFRLHHLDLTNAKDKRWECSANNNAMKLGSRISAVNPSTSQVYLSCEAYKKNTYPNVL